jgi:hypothetical protein
MSRSYVYKQKTNVAKIANELSNPVADSPILILDKATIERIILTLTLDCQSPNSGVQRFFEVICGINMSAGRISEVINEAAKRAQAYDDSINLSGINQMAIDEIFQCGKPILTGVDPVSTYTFLLEEATDRKASTWAIYLDDRKDKGLNPKTSINDGGLGLMAGIPEVFPEAEIQADTFHALQNVGKEVSKLERKALKLINGETGLKEKLAGKRPRAKHSESLAEIQPKMNEAIGIYDKINILFTWLQMLLSFSGYSLKETHILAEWVLWEMEVHASGNPGLMKEVTKVCKLLPSLLSFIGRLERGMEAISAQTGVPVEAYKLMYRQLSYSPNSTQGINKHCKLVLQIGEKYAQARDELDRLLETTKKASSLVENLNGRIRVFIEVKRVIPTRFFVLLKVFYNTRKYKRSRHGARKGKSPLELLTNTTQPDFLESLGY